MRRVLTEKLIEWKEDVNKKPLILKGVPMCGKTYLLKEFGSGFYSDVVYLNFEEDVHLADLFMHNLHPDRIIKDISLLHGKDIKPDSTLIIFDCIHTCPKAIYSLQYFNEHSTKYHIASTGLFFDTGLPNVDVLTLYPMNFYEFLLAQNSLLAMHLKESGFSGDALHIFNNQLKDLYTDYQIVGGMPEVVQNWINTKSIESVDKLQSQQITCFESTFAKYAPTSMFPKLSAIWNSVPAQLTKENRKFMFSKVKKSWRAKDLEDALYWLIRAGFVYKAEHTDKPEFPLSGHVDHTHFKLYMCDIGLLRRTARIPASVITDKTKNYKEIKGAFAENSVCCDLKIIYENDIFYWSAENPARAEVEFVIQDGSDIIPIAAKYGSVSRTRSLMQYSIKFKPKKSVLTSIENDKPDILPIYAFWNLKQWLEYQYPKT